MPSLAYFEPVKGLIVYGRELLPHLARYYDVDVFTDEVDALSEVVGWDMPTYRYQDFEQRRRGYAHRVFQLRNNRDHVPVYDRLVRYGGVIVLHDVNISGIIGAKTLMVGRKLAFLRELWRNEGWGPFVHSSLDVVLRRRWPGETDYMMNRVACRRSQGIIVHNEQAHAAVQGVVDGAPTTVVRRGVPPVTGQVDPVAARGRLMLPAQAFTVVSLGYVTPRKRIPQALAAFAQLVDQVPDAQYVLAGKVLPGFDVEGLIRHLGLTDRVRVTGWVDEVEFYDYLAAADVCVNLRYPVEGETSSVALRMMSYGKPTLVSNAGSMAELPYGTCLKIRPDAGEVEAIHAALARLARDEQRRERLGQQAQQYVRRHRTWEGAAAGYHRFLERVARQRGSTN
jgi:glycosyltransferase involved in cell wall biosynthesis